VFALEFKGAFYVMGVPESRKGYGNPKKVSLCVGFFFSSSGTLRSLTIVTGICIALNY